MTRSRSRWNDFTSFLFFIGKNGGRGWGMRHQNSPPPLSIFPVLIGVGWVAALILCCRRHVGAAFRAMFAGGGLALHVAYTYCYGTGNQYSQSNMDDVTSSNSIRDRHTNVLKAANTLSSSTVYDVGHSSIPCAIPRCRTTHCTCPFLLMIKVESSQNEEFL